MSSHPLSAARAWRRLFPALLAGLCCATGTQAQTSLQLYGLLDAGVARVSGLSGGSVTQVVSGIMEGSRWGLKGSEDLGGGYRAVFTVESRFEADTGALFNRPVTGSQVPDRIASASALGLPGSLNGAVAGVNQYLATKIGVNVDEAAPRQFDRQIYTGLVTPYGAILAGRQYTPAYEVYGLFDAMQTQSALAGGQIAAFPISIDIRLSNTVQYRVEQAGWAASVMLGAGESGNSSSNKRFFGAMARYQGEGYAFGVGFNTRNNELGQRSLTNVSAGVKWDVGPGTFSAMYASNQDDHPSDMSVIAPMLTPSLTVALGNNPTAGAAAAMSVQNAYLAALQQDSRLLNIGYRITCGPHTVTVAYNTLNDRTVHNADARSYGAAYTYALSKRTDLNAVLVRVDNSANSQLAPGGNGYAGGFTRAAGVDSTSLALGIRHRF